MKGYPFSHFPSGFGDHCDGPIIKLKTGHFDAPLFSNDSTFDRMYPEYFQLLSNHWTPLAIARKAAGFLAEPGARVLDIGSGIGKFCLAAGYHFPETFFYGVEQRHELIYLAEEAKGRAKLPNVNFIYANITEVNFNRFDHFYFYNAFYENVDQANKIDDSIELSESLYIYYTQYLYSTLNEKAAGCRLVTYHSRDDEVPPGFKLAGVFDNALLKMWIKE
ncbi:MAG TPA: class I SAM-dependent methyltransferase [Mucilaginibacter sp.]